MATVKVLKSWLCNRMILALALGAFIVLRAMAGRRAERALPRRLPSSAERRGMAAAGSGKGDKKGCRKMLVAVNGSAAGTHAPSGSLPLAAHEKSWITVVSVAPP
ncbi:MAG: hypothetical protein U0411_14005 [Thermodesulfovibrionales bacterium]